MHSFRNANGTFEINTKSVWNICQSLVVLGEPWLSKTHIFHASTSEMYGDHKGANDTTATATSNSSSGAVKFSESSSFKPMSPYAVSKVSAYYTCDYYQRVYNLNICTAISFNHESPLRHPFFVTRKITQAAARQFANLKSKSDYTHQE